MKNTKESPEAGLPDGQGIHGRFLGLPDQFHSYETASISIVQCPFEGSTSYGQGTSHGPSALIEASRSIEGYDVETESELFRSGIHTMEPLLFSSASEMTAGLYKEVQQLLQDNKFPVVIGGEHTISQAPIRACAEQYGKLSVLQFDAHTDLRAAYEGNPFSHASVMARVREIDEVENICAVGIRAVDISEAKVLVREDVFFDHELQHDSNWVERVLSRLGQKVYISFDIDAFNSATMPATGTPEPGGIDWFQALALLKAVCRSREVVGFDLVELMPLDGFFATDFLAAKLIYKFLNYRFKLHD